MALTTYHVSVSIDIDRFSDSVLKRKWLSPFRKAGMASTVAELRALCQTERARGREGWPIGCPSPDPITGNCPGHPQEENPSP